MSEQTAALAKPPHTSPWIAFGVGAIAVAAAFFLAWTHGGLASETKTIGFNPLYETSSVFVGLLVGLTGVGGGVLMKPLLVLLFGFHPATAVGTNLLYASATKSVDTLVHGANKTIDWRITSRLAPGSIPSAILTVALLYVLHLNGNADSKLISTTLGFALVLTTVALLFRQQIYQFAAT